MAWDSAKTNGPIYNVPDKGFYHGFRKSEVLNHIGDDTYGKSGRYEGFIRSASDMSKTNPFKSDKQRAFLAINKPEVAHKFAMHSKKKK
jgi:hypothetical protein